MRLLPESGQVLLAAAILSASIIVRPAPPVIAETGASEPTVLVELVFPEGVFAGPEIVFPEIVIPNYPDVVVQVPEFPAPVVVEPSEPVIVERIVERDGPERVVEVERIVEVPSCLDYADLPHFDLANALTAAFPGALWGLNGSHYNGLTWRDESPKPDMTAIIGGWLAFLSEDC